MASCLSFLLMKYSKTPPGFRILEPNDIISSILDCFMPLCLQRVKQCLDKFIFLPTVNLLGLVFLRLNMILYPETGSKYAHK